MERLWWHWVVLGLGLIVLGLLAPASDLICLGPGALLTGLVAVALPLGFTVQGVLGSRSSALMAGIWPEFFRNYGRTCAGQSREGALGMIPGGLVKSLQALRGGRK
jgi:inner membrane protein